MIEFKLPSLGADMDEGKLLEWRVKPGDAVKKGDVVAVVDTTKSAIDVESWQEGIVHELIARPGDTLPVGAVMALLREPGETPEQAERRKREHAAPAPAPLAPSPAPQAAPVAAAEAARRRISPAARKRAAELGVDVSALIGTGPEGAVTLEDVERAAKPPAATAGERAAEMRRTIAAAMARAKREIPHYYLSTEVPLARASAWLAAQNEKREVTGRLLMAVLFLKATALALKRYPDLNGFFREGRFEPGPGIHLGVAISLRQGGLIAPALHDVDAKPLDKVMMELADLVSRARAFSLRSSEFSDPTVTVTNLGDQGVDLVHGIIYPPQVALVGFGRVSERVWAENGKAVIGPAVTASLSADHRVSDGHRGALFLAELARLLQEPERL
jgi:pyruvate dehydrogenase E2 component (dihydrolipoamide acetyltransferase)